MRTAHPHDPHPQKPQTFIDAAAARAYLEGFWTGAIGAVVLSALVAALVHFA